MKTIALWVLVAGSSAAATTSAGNESCANCALNGASQIVNGRETQEYASVKMLEIDRDGYRYLCTATKVKPGVYITAAHCIFNKAGKVVPASDMRVVRSRSSRPDELDAKAPRIDAVTAVPFPAYVHDGADKLKAAGQDVAIIKFDPRLDDDTPAMKLASSGLKEWSKYRVVGFGNNRAEGKGTDKYSTKRIGQNRVDLKSDGYYVSHGYAADQAPPAGMMDKILAKLRTPASSIGSGDSGGPMFNTKDELVGINSHGMQMTDVPGSRDGAVSMYTDLTQDRIRTWLREHGL